MHNAKYRIIQDANGDFIAQVASRKYDERGFSTQWLFFMDFEEVDSLEAAEICLQVAIRSKQQRILEHYDEDGRRLPKTDYQG